MLAPTFRVPRASIRRLVLVLAGLMLALGLPGLPSASAASPGKATITSVTGAGVDQIKVAWKPISDAKSIDIEVSWDKTPLKARTAGKYFKVTGVSGSATSKTVTIPDSFKPFIGSSSGNPAYVRIIARNGSKSSTSGVAYGWPSSRPVVGTQVRVATYNVTSVSATASMKGMTWDDRRTRVQRSIMLADPWVVAIQEASTADVTISGNKLDHYQDLANLLSSKYRIAYSKVGNADGGTKGDHIFYNFNLLKLVDSGLTSGNSLPGTSWGKVKNRYFAWALFEVNETGARFFVVSSHFQGDSSSLGNVKKLRVSVAKGIDGYIEDRNPNHLPVIIAGDFNTRIDRAQDDAPTALVKLGYVDSASADSRTGEQYSTSNSGFPSKPKPYSDAGPRIDYIFAKNAGGPAERVNQVKLLDDGTFDPDYYGSDHSLQWANISLGRSAG